MEKNRSQNIWRLLGTLQLFLTCACILITILSIGTNWGYRMRMWAQTFSMLLLGLSFFIIFYVPFHFLWYREKTNLLILALQIPILLVAIGCLVLHIAAVILRFG